MDHYQFFKDKGFLPVDKESLSVFKQFTAEDNMLADMNATVAVIWSVCYTVLYKIIHGYLCSVWFCNGNPLYGGIEFFFQIHRPLANSMGQAAAYSELLDVLYDLSLEGGNPALLIGAVEGRFLEEYQAFNKYNIKAEYSEDHSEYLFKIQDLLELSGGVNEDKRRHLKKCEKVSNISLRPMTKENSLICLDIEEQWCQRQDCPACESFVGCEKKVLKNLVDLFDDKVYKGLFLYQEEKPEGYVIWEKTSEKTAFLYLGKSNIRDYFVYLIYNMVKTYLSGTDYLNMGEDMGKMGLRIFKRHLGLYELRQKFFCTFTRAGV